MKINLLQVPIIYINLDNDVEKKQSLENLLANMGFKNVIRLPAVLNNDKPKIGLASSHFLALNLFKPPFIILEDDVDIMHFQPFLEIPDESHALYLGNSQWGYSSGFSGFYLKYSHVSNFPELVRIYNMLSSHAILYLSDEYVEMCKKTAFYCSTFEKYPLPFDVPIAYIQRFFNIFAVNRPFFVQTFHKGQMSNAANYTNKAITEYQTFDKPDASNGVFVLDQIF